MAGLAHDSCRTTRRDGGSVGYVCDADPLTFPVLRISDGKAVQHAFPEECGQDGVCLRPPEEVRLFARRQSL
eukprot:scaffold1496_cov110-Isochrysis_galbana.AAC.8